MSPAAHARVAVRAALQDRGGFCRAQPARSKEKVPVPEEQQDTAPQPDQRHAGTQQTRSCLQMN